MKLGDDALLAILDAFRRGLVEMTDISDILRNIELVPGPDEKLHVPHKSEPKDE